METKTIGGFEYRKMNGIWHGLSSCGYLWVECDKSMNWAVDGWIS
jgi:hypothetical protein